MSNDLIVVGNMTAVEIFAPEKVDELLGKIKEEVSKFKGDMTTKKGRDEIASFAYKIARSKTFLDKAGKDLGEDARKQIELINAERKKIVTELDKLRDEVRAPLDAWEQKEKDRIAKHEELLSSIKTKATESELGWRVLPYEQLESNFKSILEMRDIFPRDWEEFSEKAKETLDLGVFKTEKALDDRRSADNKRAEEEKAKKEAEEKARLEREEQIAREAAAKAKKDAEEKAQREKEELERKAKADADAAERKIKEEQENISREKARAEAAEAARLSAEKRAKEEAAKAEIDKQKAVEAERARVLAEENARKEQEKAAAAKREANIAHKKKINNAILAAIMEKSGITKEQGIAIITAMALGEVPHLRIEY